MILKTFRQRSCTLCCQFAQWPVSAKPMRSIEDKTCPAHDSAPQALGEIELCYAVHLVACDLTYPGRSACRMVN
jgi:hypothetical protein